MYTQCVSECVYGGFVYITLYEILMLVNLYTHVYSKDIFRIVCAVDFLFSTPHRSTTPFLYGKINFRPLHFVNFYTIRYRDTCTVEQTTVHVCACFPT